MKGSRVSTYKPRPGEEEAAARTIPGRGWTAPANHVTEEEATVDPKTIGYPANPEEMKTFLKKQAQRHWRGVPANGLITETDKNQILQARAKRERQALRMKG